MIIGHGIDICDIRRIEQQLTQFGARFKKRVFTKGEQVYADAKADPAAAYAKRFAAKEALAKALSTRSTGHLKWRDVEVTNGPSGKPELILHGEAFARLVAMMPKGHTPHLCLSLSDEPPYAIASVIIESAPS